MVFLGKISKSRGNRGEVVCQISPGIDSSKIHPTGKFELRSKKYIKSAKMEFFSERGSSLIIKFDISNSIGESLKLLGYDVYYENDESPEYLIDLSGFSVFDSKGNFWGVVESVNFSEKNQMLQVVEGDTFILIPYNDSIVSHIDKAARKIIVDPPEGLRDLNP